jgi:hypothetical protein
MVYTRGEDGRFGIQSVIPLEGTDASIEIPGFGLSVPFSDLYEGPEQSPDRTP